MKLTRHYCRNRDSGATTIFVCMIMLILITVFILSSFSLSTMNLRVVNNVQTRGEAVAAANEVLERVISFDFTTNPAGFAGNYPVDINADLVDEYQVELQTPACVRATPVNVTSASSVTLPGLTVTAAWNTVWELDATATEAASGVSVRVRKGVRVLLSDTEKSAVCA